MHNVCWRVLLWLMRYSTYLRRNDLTMNLRECCVCSVCWKEVVLVGPDNINLDLLSFLWDGGFPWRSGLWGFLWGYPEWLASHPAKTSKEVQLTCRCILVAYMSPPNRNRHWQSRTHRKTPWIALITHALWTYYIVELTNPVSQLRP